MTAFIWKLEILELYLSPSQTLAELFMQGRYPGKREHAAY
jgi:hypothetical protein